MKTGLFNSNIQKTDFVVFFYSYSRKSGIQTLFLEVWKRKMNVNLWESFLKTKISNADIQNTNFVVFFQLYCRKSKNYSVAGNRTRALRVRAANPNH